VRSRFHSFLCALIAFAAPVCAQAPAQDASASAVDAVEAALQRWQMASGTRGAERRAALDQLAKFDDARVTAALLAELERAGNDTFAVQVLDAIGQRPRPDAVPALQAALQRAGSPPPVQKAAATAIARQGNRGIDWLLELVRADGDAVRIDVRVASALGLAAVGDDRAWRGLAPLALRGSTPERQAVLRLLAPAHDVGAVTQVRLRLLLDGDPVLAATAWHQLAVEHHPRARTAFEDLVERLGSSPAPEVLVELIEGLGLGVWNDAYAPFLRFAASERPAVQAVLRRVAGGLAADASFARWLLAEAIDNRVAAERRVAFMILGKAPAETVQPLLDKVRQGLQHPTPDTLELALALGDLLAKDAHWPDDVKHLLASGDPAVRTAGFALLFDLGVGDAIEQAQHNLNAKEWELRSVAYRYLLRWRALASIPLLIARVDKEQGRLSVELNDALFAHCGVRCWTRAEWEAWWKKHRDTHALPAAATVAQQQSRTDGPTVAYYGIRLVSKRTIFLIDCSGSMLAKIGTDKKHTRLDEAKRQLRNVVEQLPEDQLFNVMSYEGTVTPVWDALHKATPADKAHVLDLLAKAAVGRGGTNIHDALELAFRDPDVDTIYLLSDGEPTVGKIVDVTELAAAVRRWNYTRQIVVHTISLGTDSKLLQQLAQDSGGQYVMQR